VIDLLAVGDRRGHLDETRSPACSERATSSPASGSTPTIRAGAEAP
jgi:hypothetical protein